MVRPAPVRCCTCTPLTVMEQLTSRPTLMMLTLAESLAGWASLTSLLHGSITLNSVCNTPPVSTYVMLMARPSPETLYTTVSVAPGVAGPVGLVVGGVLGSVGRGKAGMVG